MTTQMKPSELFEGEESSLRKTFDRVVTTQTSQEDWEKEFDKNFPCVESWSMRRGDFTEVPIPYIKAFISSLLSRKDAEKETLVKEIIEAVGKEKWTEEPKRNIIRRSHIEVNNRVTDRILSALREIALKAGVKIK